MEEESGQSSMSSQHEPKKGGVGILLANSASYKGTSFSEKKNFLLESISSRKNYK